MRSIERGTQRNTAEHSGVDAKQGATRPRSADTDAATPLSSIHTPYATGLLGAPDSEHDEQDASLHVAHHTVSYAEGPADENGRSPVPQSQRPDSFPCMEIGEVCRWPSVPRAAAQRSALACHIPSRSAGPSPSSTSSAEINSHVACTASMPKRALRRKSETSDLPNARYIAIR